MPTTLLVVLSSEEVARVPGLLRGTHGLIGLLLYDSGLRVTEFLIRVKEVDLDRGEVTVRRGKDGKDRVTVIPETVRGPLREHLGRVQALHGQDLAKRRMGRDVGRAGRQVPPGGVVVAVAVGISGAAELPGSGERPGPPAPPP